MRNIKALFPLAALLLAACSINPKATSSASPSSFSEQPSSQVPSTSLTPLEQDKKAMDDYIDSLKEIDGHPKKATVTVETHDYLPLEMVTVDSFTVEVFKREGNLSNVLIRKGIITINGNKKDQVSYEMQMFAADGMIYQLSKESGETPKQSFVEDTKEGREIELTLSFAAKQADNFSFLSRVMDLEGVSYGLELGDIPSGDGSFSFAYQMTSYVMDNGVATATKDEEITHELEVSKENGVIKSYSYAYEDDLYYGGQAVNSKVSFTNATLEHGDYDLFADELWDPSEFRAS
ncbi:MAG: hypothetical protein J6328_01580 [Bacilli bacterium]|nr:hypothetical protein [Bacilli bacterium]